MNTIFFVRVPLFANLIWITTHYNVTFNFIFDNTLTTQRVDFIQQIEV